MRPQSHPRAEPAASLPKKARRSSMVIANQLRSRDAEVNLSLSRSREWLRTTTEAPMRQSALSRRPAGDSGDIALRNSSPPLRTLIP